jgi:hypothetical protein
VFVACRIRLIKNLLEVKEKERQVQMKNQHAAIVIQRWYRKILELRLNRARKGALMIIAKYSVVHVAFSANFIAVGRFNDFVKHH